MQTLDQIWKDHLLQLDHLRQGIGLRAYAQKDPLNEYKQEAFKLFDTMLARLRASVTGVLVNLEKIQPPPAPTGVPEETDWREVHEEPEPAFAVGGTRPVTARTAPGAVVDPDDPSTWGKVARNAQCPCGSGRKYKHCHGRLG